MCTTRLIIFSFLISVDVNTTFYCEASNMIKRLIYLSQSGIQVAMLQLAVRCCKEMISTGKSDCCCHRLMQYC